MSLFKTNTAKPASLASATPKGSFIIRWGNIIFLVLLFVLTIFIVATTSKRHTVTTTSFAGSIAFGLTALTMVVLSFIRIFKKYHWIKSLLWLLITPVLAFLLTMGFLPKEFHRNQESKVNSSREDISCPFDVIERSLDDFPVQSEAYIEETIYHDFKVIGTTRRQVSEAVKKCIPAQVKKELITKEGLGAIRSVDSISGVADPIIARFEDIKMQGQECKPTWVGIHIYTDIYMPKLDTPQPGFQSAWDTFIRNLQIHEDGHRDIAVTGAKKISNALMAMTASDCETLEKNMTKKQEELFKEIQRQEDAYDKKTNHGETQGVAF